MTRTFVLASHLKALSIGILDLYRANAAKDRALVKVFREAVFHQAVSLLGICFQVTFSPEHLRTMAKVSFRNGVLVIPLGEALMGTSRETRLEFHISPAERNVFLVRYNEQKTTKLNVVISHESAIVTSYKFEIARRVSGMKSSVLQVADDQDVFAIETYADLSPNGHYITGKNFPKRDFNIRDLVAKICDLRVEA